MYSNTGIMLDDIDLTPLEPTPALLNGRIISLDVNFAVYQDGLNHGTFNEIPFHLPTSTPTLLTATSLKTRSTELYGNAHAIILNKNEIVYLLVTNLDAGSHPFHLHGHNFQILDRNVAPFTAISNLKPFPSIRDTIVIPSGHYVILGFTADNPGTWLFHCHIEWHLESGLGLTFIEAVEDIKNVSSLVLDSCKNQGIPINGNANGKFGDDMSGYAWYPKPLFYGVGASGWGALVACAFSALCGIAVIVWFQRD